MPTIENNNEGTVVVPQTRIIENTLYPNSVGIIAVNEINPGRAGAIDSENVHRYTRAFHVVTAAPLVDAIAARDAIGLPQLGDIYEIEPFEYWDENGIYVAVPTRIDQQSVVVSKRAEALNDTHQVWLVTVEYDRQGSPLSEPWQITWGFAEYQKAILEDFTPFEAGEEEGDPPISEPKKILNTAGDPFDPPVTIDDARPELTLTRWESTFSPLTIKTYKDTANADAVTLGGEVFAANTLRIVSISAQRERRTFFYWKVTYTLQFNPDTWTLKLLSRGYREKNDSGQKVPALDKLTGTLPAQPVLLDADGKQVATDGEPYFQEITIYPLVDFAPLNLSY